MDTSQRTIGANQPVASGSSADLERLDIEAHADIERQWQPRAVFVHASAGHGADDRGLDAVFPAAMSTRRIPARSIFRQMMDSFFGNEGRH